VYVIQLSIEWCKWVLTNLYHGRQVYNTYSTVVRVAIGRPTNFHLVFTLECICELTLRYTMPDIHCRHRRHECDGGIMCLRAQLSKNITLSTKLRSTTLPKDDWATAIVDVNQVKFGRTVFQIGEWWDKHTVTHHNTLHPSQYCLKKVNCEIIRKVYVVRIISDFSMILIQTHYNLITIYNLTAL